MNIKMKNLSVLLSTGLVACALMVTGCKDNAGDAVTPATTKAATPATTATTTATTPAATKPVPKPAAPANPAFPADYEAENDGWLVDIDEAYNLSKKTGKPIMANFTGSDWCGWCKRLTKSVFSQEDFKSWADDNVVLLELDFPKRKQLPDVVRAQNQNLQRAFQVRGYPTVWLFDLNKNDSGQFDIAALGKSGYKKTVGEFTGEFDQYLAQRK